MKLFFSGDFLIAAKQDCKKLLSPELYEIVNACDFSCCNLEGPIIEDTMEPIEKAGPLVYQCKNVADILKESGIKCVTLANNHIMDFGEEGLKYTLEQLKKNKINSLGADLNEKDIYSYKRILGGDSVTVGIISVAENGFGAAQYNNPGYAYMFNPHVLTLIKKAKEECRYVIMNCHCGAEELSVPLPEVRELYHFWIDMGVSVVIGHHPHVIQGMETYQQGMIYYSLGNFAFDSLDNPNNPYNSRGLSVIVEINKNSIKCQPITTEYSGTYISICCKNREFEDATEILLNKVEYYNLINRFCKQYYYDAYRSYCCQAVGFHDKSVFQRCKMAVKLFLNKKINYNDAYIYHNIAIETNQWMIKRAIME